MKQTAKNTISELKKHSNPAQAKLLQGFFKTGKGQYGHRDVFWGIMVPTQRTVAGKFADLPLSEIKRLLESNVHERRFTALIILLNQFKKGDANLRDQIHRFYLRHLRFINNWDLVDVSAKNIVGEYLFDKGRSKLYKMIRSKNLWERRVAVLATFYFISKNQFKDSLAIAKFLIKDSHDLIHKATGWMLREVGKKDEKVLTRFLDANAHEMPRTMLRYSIERLSPKLKKYYLAK